MVQAAACRAALYGFNSHPQLQFPSIDYLFFFEDLSAIIVFSNDLSLGSVMSMAFGQGSSMISIDLKCSASKFGVRGRRVSWK